MVSKKVTSLLLSAMLLTSAAAMRPVKVDALSLDAIYANAYTSTMSALQAKTQISINEARQAISQLPENLDWAIGEFSKQVDSVQQPIFSKAYDAVVAAQTTPTQANINAAKAAIDPDMPAFYKSSYSSAVDAVQQDNMQKAVDAYNKALQSGVQADIDAAKAIFDDIKTSTNSSIVEWVDLVQASNKDEKPVISNVSMVSNSSKGNTKAKNGDIITLTFTSSQPVTKLGNFKINGSNPDTFTNVGNVYTATHLVDAGDVVGGVASFQINVKNGADIYSQTIEQTADGSSVTIVDEKPVISNVSITSNNIDSTKASNGDIITVTFTADEAVTKLSNFKINGSNPDTFTNVGNVYTATHLVDAGDVVGGAASFQINVKNAAGIYSQTIEQTTDGSSVTIVDKKPAISNVSILSNNADSTKAKSGDIIILNFTADEAVTKLSSFKINGSNPDVFTHVGNVYTAIHLVDSGDVVGGVATFQINVENANGIYSQTIEQTSNGSSVAIIK